jgi:ribonuclease T1
MVKSWRSRGAAAVLVVVLAILAYGLWTWAASPTNQVAGSTGRAGVTGTPAPTAATQPSADLDPETGLPWIAAADLPAQGRAVLASIDKGGPYPYSEDGQTFLNAERLLPAKAKGFYTEYTVKLPGSTDRGPVRIVMGGKGQWYFWTDDHYASFSRIRR